MVRIRFEPVARVSDEDLDRHRAYSRSLGLPEIVSGTAGAAAPSLAVVGGSPSVAGYIDRLRNWDGDILAINGAWEWCRDNGIDAIFYTIDPIVGAPENVERAILGDTCSPALFDALSGANIELVRLGLDNILPASTSAGTVPAFACWRGHRHITFFGCESSFTERTHVYDKPLPMNLVWVDCGGVEYVTNAQMIMQAEWLAQVARAWPEYITVEGEGFLPALIEHGEYDVTHVNPDLAGKLNAA
jgi:hypothetical protein